MNDNNYLIDYTVRNITTGDEEDIRVLELGADEFEGFPEQAREEIRGLVTPLAIRFAAGESIHPEWDVAQERILTLLLPFISDSWLYHRDYTAWENNLLTAQYDPIPPEPIERALLTFPPEQIGDAFRRVLNEAVDAAIENWNEGFWDDVPASVTYGDVLRRFVGYVEAWMEGAADDEPFTDRILEEPLP